MTLNMDGDVIATARVGQHAAADGTGAWIVSTYPARLLTRNQAMTHRLIRITTALAVVAVAGVAAIISYQHAYKLVTSHGETGPTARRLTFTA